MLSGTPTNDDVGAINVELTASDIVFSVSDVFVLTVENVNDPPTLVSAIPDQSASVGMPYSLHLSDFFEDVDVGDSLTYAAEIQGGADLPSWLSLNSSTGELSGTPGIGDVTAGINLSVTATDGSDASAADVFELVVFSDNTPPDAVDDDGFLVNHESYVAIPLAELLANDTDDDSGQTLTPTVDSLSNLGATISVLSDHVIYDPSSSATLSGLVPGQSQTDTFQYTVSDGAGGMDTATVSVDVSGEDNQVAFSFKFTDTLGGDVTQVTVGEDFNLEIYAAELPTPDEIVFSAYLDVVYGGGGAQVIGNPAYNVVYGSGRNEKPDVIAVNGLIDEVGALTGTTAQDAGEPILLVTVPMRATTAGTIRFVGDSTDELPIHEVLRSDGVLGVPVPPDELLFESATLEAVAPMAASVMLEDVNGDGAVSPVDAMLVIRALDEAAAAAPQAVAVSFDASAGQSDPSQSESELRLDVNRDGHVSPVDALMVLRVLDQQNSTSAIVSSPVAETVVAGTQETTSEAAVDLALAEEPTGSSDLAVPTYEVDLLARRSQDAGHADDDDDERADAALDAVLADLELTV